MKQLEKEEVTITLSLNDHSFYNVVYLNDDTTLFEFVILSLEAIFGYELQQAIELTSYIHKHGRGIVATLPQEEAFEKAKQVEAFGEKLNQNLQVLVEKQED